MPLFHFAIQGTQAVVELCVLAAPSHKARIVTIGLHEVLAEYLARSGGHEPSDVVLPRPVVNFLDRDNVHVMEDQIAEPFVLSKCEARRDIAAERQIKHLRTRLLSDIDYVVPDSVYVLKV